MGKDRAFLACYRVSLATWLAGGLRVGAAKVSVLASAFFGSISDSASANVASTGAVTLPAMRRLGYPPSFAAAVEAVASSGGQIMPPLMGAGAFIMVELLRIRYSDVMTAALLPAVLFFLVVWVGVDGFARRYGLRPVSAQERPSRDTVLRTLPFFALPFGVLLIMLFATGYTPQFSAALAIITAAALLITDRSLRFDVKAFAQRFNDASVIVNLHYAQLDDVPLALPGTRKRGAYGQRPTKSWIASVT